MAMNYVNYPCKDGGNVRIGFDTDANSFSLSTGDNADGYAVSLKASDLMKLAGVSKFLALKARNWESVEIDELLNQFSFLLPYYL